MRAKKELKKILIVDDDDEYNFLTEDIISDTSLECELVFMLSARDALKYLEEVQTFPDLILLDINMPIMNGWEFLAEYQARNYHLDYPTVIIMTSSSVYEEDKKKALTYSRVVEYLPKPLQCKDVDRITTMYFEPSDT